MAAQPDDWTFGAAPATKRAKTGEMRAISPPAVGLGTLSRIAAIGADSAPVLSVYLGFDSDRPEACRKRFEALIAMLGSQPPQIACEWVRASLRAPLLLAHGTRGIALFVTADGRSRAMVSLPQAVEGMVVVEAIPWLEPVVGMLTSGAWGAAVLDRGALRLFRGGEVGLVEFASVSAEPHRISEDRASNAGMADVVHEVAFAQSQRLGSMLGRAHARANFSRLVLAAPRDLWPAAELALTDELRRRLVGTLELRPSLGEPRLRSSLLYLLSGAQDAKRVRCPRSSATGTPDHGPTILSQTSTRIMRPLPQASAGVPVESERLKSSDVAPGAHRLPRPLSREH